MNGIEYYILTIAVFAMLNGIQVLGLNIQFGVTGILNLAYIVLVAVGAYATGIATLAPSHGTYMQYIGGFGWVFPWNLAFGVLMTLIFAAALAFVSLGRIAHWYLALTLAAIGQGILVFVGNDIPFLNGDSGLYGVKGPLESQLSQGGYQLLLLAISAAFLAILWILFIRIEHSPLGRALRCVREDETAAAALGKNLVWLRGVAFMFGALAAGVAGGLSILYIGGWSSNSWLPGETFVILASLIIGGRGWSVGAMLGGFVVLTVFVQGASMLPTFGGHIDLIPTLQAVLAGLLFLAVLWWRPAGLWPEPKERFRLAQSGAGPSGESGEVESRFADTSKRVRERLSLGRRSR